jgi:hypothetical protein
MWDILLVNSDGSGDIEYILTVPNSDMATAIVDGFQKFVLKGKLIASYPSDLKIQKGGDK